MNSDNSASEAALPRSEEERQQRNKALLLGALQRAGAARATVTYHGGGDEGSDDGATALDAQGATVDLSATVSIYEQHSQFSDGQWTSDIVLKEQPLAQALCAYAMEAVWRLHRGWENNEGGDGEVVFDCTDGTARLEHNEYYLESDRTETSL